MKSYKDFNKEFIGSKVYRAEDFGCIIQLLEKEEI